MNASCWSRARWLLYCKLQTVSIRGSDLLVGMLVGIFEKVLGIAETRQHYFHFLMSGYVCVSTSNAGDFRRFAWLVFGG